MNNSTDATKSQRKIFPPNLAIIVSISAISTASIIIRLSSSPALVIATYRLAFSTLILFPFFIASKGYVKLAELGFKGISIILGVGVVLAIHFASWITSLSMTSVASSVIFVHIDPLFVAVVSHFIFRERITRKTIAGVLIAFTGATIIALGDMRSGNMNLIGDTLAIVGGLMLGIYILAGRHIRQRLDLISYVTPVYAMSTLVLLVGSLVSSIPLYPYSTGEYLIFLILALIPMIFGHTLYNWALGYVKAPIVSISLLGEPVGASLLAFLVLGEAPTTTVIIGGIITLFGIGISLYQR